MTISHWGNIALWNKYELSNIGAKTVGEFNRLEMNRYNPNKAMYCLRKLDAELPRNAWGIEYYDEIGNISTSNAWKDGAFIKMTLEPRFYLCGEWNFTF